MLATTELLPFRYGIIVITKTGTDRVGGRLAVSCSDVCNASVSSVCKNSGTCHASERGLGPC